MSKNRGHRPNQIKGLQMQKRREEGIVLPAACSGAPSVFAMAQEALEPQVKAGRKNFRGRPNLRSPFLCPGDRASWGCEPRALSRLSSPRPQPSDSCRMIKRLKRNFDRRGGLDACAARALTDSAAAVQNFWPILQLRGPRNLPWTEVNPRSNP